MVKYGTGHCRRASWIVLFLVGLAMSVLAAGNPSKETNGQDVNVITDAQRSGQDNQDEASAVHTEALKAIAALKTSSRHASEFNSRSSTLLESILPSPLVTLLRMGQHLQSFSPARLFSKSWKLKRGDEARGRAIQIIDLLEHAIELGSVDALYSLGQISMFPPHLLPLNLTRSFSAFERHAQLTGNSTSLSMAAFFHATGYDAGAATDSGAQIPIDQAKALLYYTFAAQSGDFGAQMALGYRYWTGISVNDNCLAALDWYEAAAEQSMARFLSGPPGGRTLPLTYTKLSDLDGGVYGPGASVASTGLQGHRYVIKAATARAAGETWDDVLEYYRFSAEGGDLEFIFRLGKILYQGSVYPTGGGVASGAEGVGAVPRDFQRAKTYFLRIARLVWPHNAGSASVKKEVDDKTLGYAKQSAGLIGRMFLRGEGGSQDFKLARVWFERGAEHGDREAVNGLGIIYRDGLGVQKDMKRALNYFALAAGHELAEAQVNLGKYYYAKGDYSAAVTYFETAMRLGSPYEPYYYMAEIHASRAQNPTNSAALRAGSCPIAVSFYKLVAERGAWKEDLLTQADDLWKLGTGIERKSAGGGVREHQEAMLRWFLAAERGYEIAQNNIAWLSDQAKRSLLSAGKPTQVQNATSRLALTYWIRSAAQRNIDALVKVGDYYFYGLGVEDMPDSLRYEKAAGYYHSASDTQVSALAMWNLGWMYENGVGVTQDFYLAKRYYDLALETNSEAYLPVLLSLIKLYLRSLWHEMLGGGGQAVSLWHDGSDDDHWYIGKSRADRERRIKGRKGVNELEGGPTDSQEGVIDEDPVEWARNRRNAEGDSTDGPDDYFEAALRERGRARAEEDEDEVVETFVLLFLCALVSFLIWLRGRWVERQRREEGGQQQQQPQQDGGLFPPRGDPARQDWAILR